MGRREEQPMSLPVFEVQTPAPVQTETPGDDGVKFKFSPEAWRTFSDRSVAHISAEDQRRKEMNAAFLGVYGPRPNAGALAAGPQDGHRQIASGPAHPPTAHQATPGQTKPKEHNPTPTTPDAAPQKSLKEHFIKHRRSSIAGIVAVSAVAVIGAGYVVKQSGASETSATLQVQPLSKELKNDTFTDGTALAISNIATGQDLEARVPVTLKEPGHTAYVSIPIAQFNLPVPITAKAVLDTKSKGRAVWARLDKNSDEYTIDRAAFALSAKPWVDALRQTKTGVISEDVALAGIAKTILPAASPYQTLIVDNQLADWKKYPDASYPPVILKDVTNPKQPKYTYDTNFLRELVDRMQSKTLEDLEDPQMCSQVLPALDASNVAALKQLNNLDKNINVTVNQKTSYGKASDAFKNDPAVKAALGRNEVSIEKFSLSCPTEPVIAKPPSASTNAPSTKTPAPAKK